MRFFGFAFGAAAMLTVGAANAGVVYDTTGLGNPTNGTKPVTTGSHGPLGDSFIVSSTETITSISFKVKDATDDTGSVLLYLATNGALGAPTIPTSSGTTLTGATLLGQIQDSGLFNTFGNNYTLVTIMEDLTLNPGTYWIEMVDASSLANGNGNPTPTNLQWGYSTTPGFASSLGVPTSGNIFSTADSGPTGVTGGTSKVFEMQITTPEPASLTVVGVGLMGLGLSRRRAKKATA